MKSKKFIRPLAWLLVLLLTMPAGGWAQGSGAAPAFKQEELEAILAPVALYPDELLAQTLMGSTYPLEIVEADRFVKANPNLKGDQVSEVPRSKELGPKREVVGKLPIRTRHDERETRVDTKAGRCVYRTGKRCNEYGPDPAAKSPGFR